MRTNPSPATPTSRPGTRFAAKLLLGGAIAVAALTGTATSAHAADCPVSPTIIVAKAGVTTQGTACADKIYGTTGADVINGNGGDDVIYSGEGADTVNGGGGNDDVYSGSGNDVIDAGSGDDELFGGFGNDQINGSMGKDTIRGEEGNDTLFDWSGSNDPGADWIRGGDGDDYLNGYEGSDYIEGGDGNDTFESHEVTPVYDYFVGQAGIDTFSVKDAGEQDFAHRDVVDKDNVDGTITKNTVDVIQ